MQNYFKDEREKLFVNDFLLLEENYNEAIAEIKKFH